MGSARQYTATEIELLDQLDPDVRPLRFALSLYGDVHAAARALLRLHSDGYIEALSSDRSPLAHWEFEQALRDDAIWSAEPQLHLRLTDRGAAFKS